MKRQYAKVYSAQVSGLQAHIIDIEVDIMRGLHRFTIVGLPNTAVNESKDRVSSAIRNSGFISPKKRNQKVVVSLAPADLRKEGPVFDVGIALAYLHAVGDITFDPERKLFLGELSLDGRVRPLRGTFLLTQEAKYKGFKEIFVPRENILEVSLVKDIRIFPISSLNDVIQHLTTGEKYLSSYTPTVFQSVSHISSITFENVKGQEHAKRGLLIAGAGRHNIALYGPPGVGKTMLARSLRSILPPLTFEETVEVTSIHSVAGVLTEPIISTPPFRAPHHTSSYVSLVGGYSNLKPGEITLAHRGILFLDEFQEFEKHALETLRQPLEDKVIQISRAKRSILFPANFILVAALNPCPCGYQGSTTECRCSAYEIERYSKKISGPLVDRIDMWVEVSQIHHSQLQEEGGGETSEKLKRIVASARILQKQRFLKHPHIHTNSDMESQDVEQLITLTSQAKDILLKMSDTYKLSIRSYYRIQKLARTIADLSLHEIVQEEDVLEAFQYRPKLF